MNHCIRQLLAVAIAAALMAADASAYVTNGGLGQEWNFEPDAWQRGNNGDTSHFGWDDFSNPSAPLLPTVPFPTGARVLDDSTPDIGVGSLPIDARFFQGVNGAADWSPTTYGHVSTTGNYYSGFNDDNFADNTIAATAPASGTGGFTTVVLQILGNAALNEGLSINIGGDANWTLDKSLFSSNGTSGLYWVEWWAPGDNLTYSIDINSNYQHVAFDAVQVDTHWSPTAAALNNILVIPEPASGVLLLLFAAVISAIGLRSVHRR